MDRIADWTRISSGASANGRPIVVMVDQEDCPYCRRVEEEFFSAVLASGRYRDQVVIGKISIDSGETIIDENGQEVSTRDFLAEYGADLTPTILFLDHNKREIAERLIGLLTPDYYVYYLERTIETAIRNMAG
ncbi:MAG: thioredoxin fold domain-containing protein [Gammaproteobacteria bacterium]|nr:thioredoxin fold domain-containing protein [Gammaproteobacteria bacterium]MYD75370.1 thioredoxin fold domain-containing protein [Gammaproteobacteria bacterium]MYJ52664.1 thioredoxin fold domain-containing protein [Gammaproteobacteria bacterium]